MSKTKIDQEDDADAQGEHPSGDGLVGQAKTANSEEEDTADKVEEMLKLGDTAADDVVEEDAGDDDGVADNDSLQKLMSRSCEFNVVMELVHLAKEISTFPIPNWAGLVVPVEPDDHQNNQHHHLGHSYDD